MKNLMYAVLGLFGVLVAVVIISLLLSGSLKELERKIESYTFEREPDYDVIIRDFKALRDEFGEKTATLSLLVSDNALNDIEMSFSDIIGYAEAESYEGVATSVGRLQAEIEHLRELTGLNIKSVF